MLDGVALVVSEPVGLDVVEDVISLATFREDQMAVETPAYGLNTPDGSETIASSWFSSTSTRRSSIWALEEPNNTVRHDGRAPPTLL